jgi:hypothetical protein
MTFRTEVRRLEGERNILLRRGVLLGVPFLYLLLGLLHPTANPELGDATGLFIGLHIAQLFLIGGLAYAFWLLLEGVRSRAATVARALILPFVIAYTALDAVLGIAWGLAAEKANELPAPDQAAAGRFIAALLEPTPLGYVLYFGAGLLWLAGARDRHGALGHGPTAGSGGHGSGCHCVCPRPCPTDGPYRDGALPGRRRVVRVASEPG